jgi:pyruvate dehydrogenase E1 component beta subunit
MFGGQMRVPMVVREPIGMWRSSAAQHSQSLESWYTHIPGLVVVAPSTPADNLGLLKSAIRNDDPVVYLEHKNLWGLTGPVPDGEHFTPLGEAEVVRTGDAVTLVTWSAMRHTCAAAAEALAQEGIAAEVIDLRTLWPWDRDTVFASVERTGRLLVVHEAVAVSGFGAEIAASVAENLHDRLKAPVRRLGSPRIPVAYAPGLEQMARVSERSIVDAVRALVAHARAA